GNLNVARVVNADDAVGGRRPESRVQHVEAQDLSTGSAECKSRVLTHSEISAGWNPNRRTGLTRSWHGYGEREVCRNTGDLQGLAPHTIAIVQNPELIGSCL